MWKALLLVPVVASCTVVAKRPVKEKASQEVQDSTAVADESNEYVEEIQLAFRTLNNLTTPFDSQVDSTLPTSIEYKKSEGDPSRLGLTQTNQNFPSVFALCAELFSEIGLGNLEVASTTGTYLQEFESLNARKLTDDKARVYLAIEGLSGTSERSESLEVYIKLRAGDEEKKYSLYRKGDAEVSANYKADAYQGFTPNLVLSLDTLEEFYNDMSVYIPMYRRLTVSGKLMTLTGQGGLKRFVSSGLSWATSKYNMLVNTLDTTATREGDFRDVSVDAEILGADAEKRLGYLKFFADELTSKDQKIYADIKYNSQGEL